MSVKKDMVVIDPFAGRSVPLASEMMGLTAVSFTPMAVALDTPPNQRAIKKLNPVRITV